MQALTVDQQDRVYTVGFVDNEVHVFSPPYAPQAPVFNVPWWGLNLHGRVDLMWALCNGSAGYRVYRAGVPITAINDSVTCLGETTSTGWAEDRSAGEYYSAVEAVNEFIETLSAPIRVLVIALIPGLPPLAGLFVVLTSAGLGGLVLIRKYRKLRIGKKVTMYKSPRLSNNP